MDKPILFEKPRGVRDILPPLASRKREVEKEIAKVFLGWGYEEIVTPTFEFLETFTNGAYRSDEDNLYKFIERSGKTLVLRPDMTAPIARVVASLMKERPLPIRLSYNTPIFRQQHDTAGRDAEFTQAGVELIGDATPDADAGVIALAIHALKAAGVTGFSLAIGQVGYLQGLFEEHVAHEGARAKLAQALADKDFVAYERFVHELIHVESSREVLLQVPSLRGDIDAIERARALTQSEKALAALDNLQTIWHVIELHTVQDHVQIDLGLLLAQHYYTGAVFEGYAPNLGFPICSGGRYDDLLVKFGRPAPATGFMIGIERVLDVLEKSSPREKQERFLVLYEAKDRYPVIGFTAFLRSKRFIVTAHRLENIVDAFEENYPSNVTPIIFENGKLLSEDRLVKAMYADFCHSNNV